MDTKTSEDGSFTLNLDRTKDYYALLWADNDNTIYNTADLKAVTLKADKKPIEAFFGKTTISGKSSTINVSLKRAVAKIQLCDKNGMEAGKSVNLKYSHLPTFNTATGAVSGTAVAEDYDITSVAATAGKPFGDFWLLAPATASSTLDLTFQVSGEAAAPPVSDIPSQSNHRTNVTGPHVVPTFRVGDYY